MFHFYATDSFIKSRSVLDNHIQKEINAKLDSISLSENPLFFAKKIKSHKNILRFRSGYYRILFQLDKTDIILLLVKHRKDVYKNL